MKISKTNGTEEICLVPPTAGHLTMQTNSKSPDDTIVNRIKGKW